jgi:hypothetical protein
LAADVICYPVEIEEAIRWLPTKRDVILTIVMPPVKPCSSRSRSNIRSGVCCCSSVGFCPRPGSHR